MENIVINFDANVQELTKAIDILERMGLVAKKDADAFRALGGSSTTVVDGQNKIQKELTETEKLLSIIALQGQKTNAILSDSGNKVGQGAKKANSELGGLSSTLRNIGGAIAGAFAIGQIVSFGKEAIKLSANFNSVKNAINFIQGGAEQGAVAFKFLTDLSERLGLELVSTANAFKLFSASAQLGGVSADQTKEIFTSVAEATTALGLSADDTQGVFLALSQIISKGTVQAEELRGQIGERLPGAFELAAKSMGVTTKELNKLLEGGQVLAKDFLPGFAATLKETFSGALPQAVNGAQANLNRLSNAFTQFKVSVGDSLNSVIGGTFKLFDSLGSQTNKLISEFRAQSSEVNNLEKNIAPLLDRYDELKTKTTLSTDEQTELNNIIKKVGETLPTAITGFDEYGKAITISTDAARGLIQAQKDLTAFKNKEAIESATTQLKTYRSSVSGLVETLNRGTIAVDNLTTGITKFEKLTPTQIKGIQKTLVELNEEMRGLELSIKELKGEPLVDAEKTKEEAKQIGDSLDQLKLKLESLKKEQGAIPDVLGGGKKRFDELGKEIDILQAKIDKLTGKNKKTDNSDKKKADKEIIDSRTLLNDALTEADEEQRKKEENANKLREQNHQDLNDAIEAADKQLKKDQEDLIKENIEAEKKAADERKAIEQGVVDFVQGVIGLISEASNNYYNAQLERIDENTKKVLEAYDEQADANEELHSKNKRGDRAYEAEKKRLDVERKKAEEKADKEKRKILHDQAVLNKELALANSIINTAVAVTANLAVPVVAALIAILGAAEIAVIAAQPIPGYAKGKERIEGKGTETSDEVPARLSVGERVVKASTNRKYFPILSAIHHERFDPESMNQLAKFTPETLKRLSKVDPMLLRDLATMQPVFMKHISVMPEMTFRNDITPVLQARHDRVGIVSRETESASQVNEWDITRALDRGTHLKEGTIKQLAKAIGNEVKEKKNIRKAWR